MEFVTTNPRISKPRVRGSNPLGRANKFNVFVNTSFNVRGEPIVCTIQDACRCFMGTDLDMLVCGNYILYKDQQNIQLKEKYKNKFNLD